MGRTGTMCKASELPSADRTRQAGREVKSALLRGHSYAREVLPPPRTTSPDPMDAASEREEEAVHLAVLQCRHELDATVQEVLQSLATGQYGRCIECGQHIAVARLRAIPLAVRCLACQDRFERARRIAETRERRHDVTHMQEQEMVL